MSKRRSILCVDDDELVRDAYKEVFGSRGYGVVVVGTAEDALVEVRRERPDLVISDVVLPGGDGLELMAKMRDEMGAGAPPVIISSAFDITEAEACRRGAAVFLRKPTDGETLLIAAHLLTNGGRPTPSLARRARRAAMRARRRAHATANSAMRQMNGAAIPEHAIEGLAWLCRYLDCAAGALFLAQRRGLRLAAASGQAVAIPRLDRNGLGRELLAVVDTRSSLIIPNLRHHHSFKTGRQRKDLPPGFAVAVPVGRPGEDSIVGVLALFDREPRRFEAEDLAIVEQFGRRSSLLLGNDSGPASSRLMDDGPILTRRTFERLLQLELALAHRSSEVVEVVGVEMTDADAAERCAPGIRDRFEGPRANVGRLGPNTLGLAARACRDRTPPNPMSSLGNVPDIVSVASVQINPGPAAPPTAAGVIDTVEHLLGVPAAQGPVPKVVMRSDA